MASRVLKRCLQIGVVCICLLLVISSQWDKFIAKSVQNDSHVMGDHVHGESGSREGQNRPIGEREQDDRLGGFYPLDDLEVYIYSAFWDARFTEPRIRMFGMHKNGTDVTKMRCNFYLSQELKMQVVSHKAQAIYPYWPSLKLQYLAYSYLCKVPEFVSSYNDVVTFSVGTEGKARETVIPVSHIGKATERQNTAICVKSMWGRVDPVKLVEWVEFNRLIGVQRFVFYDTAIAGPAARVLQHYVSTGIADVIQYTYSLQMSSLMHDDPIRRHLVNDGMMMEQSYLVSTNDCLYRHRDGYKYIALVDLDEIIVPSSPEPLHSIVERALLVYPKASCFSFSTAWHFEAYKAISNSSIPTFLHMQRYLRRTPILQSQPKSIVITDHFQTVNWHSVIMMPVGFEGNKFLPWQNYGYVHHYRKECKYSKEKCQDMLEKAEIDEVIPRYKYIIKERVEPVLTQLDLL